MNAAQAAQFRTAQVTTRLPAAMLSCYTAALVELLGRTDQDMDARFCDAVQLRVRTDSPVTLFSHHRRVDVTDGGGLGYTGAPTWADTLIGLTADVEADGCVIAVADTAALPWTPKRSAAGRPHWVLVARAMHRWRVTDVFEAQLPDGRVHAADVVVDVGFLRDILTPAADRSDHVRARDEMALGEPVTCPPSHWFRWLKRSERGGPAATAGDAAAGDWTTSTGQSLHWMAAQLRQRPGLLTSWQQDLWAAARHHEAVICGPREMGPVDQARLARWRELPRALTFAAGSAARGRPRPGVIDTTIRRLAELELAAPPFKEESHAVHHQYLV